MMSKKQKLTAYYLRQKLKLGQIKSKNVDM